MGKEKGQNRITSFRLNNREIRFDQIANLLKNSDSFNAFEKETLQLIHDWISLKQVFTIHTSGSTGTPKEIEIHRQQMEVSAMQTCTVLGLMAGDKALICINTAYIGGKMMVVRSLLIGMEMIIVDPAANPFTQIQGDEWFDFIALVPLQLQTLVAKDQNMSLLNHFKAIIVGGAPVSHSLLKQIQIVKSPIFATYGMSETVSNIALKKLNGLQPDSYFNVFPGTEIGTDERDCLTIKAPVTNQVRIVTNDIVNIVSPTEFEWVGRIDNVINTGGIKVQLEILERMLYDILADFGIEDAFFVGAIDDDELGQKLILLLEGTPIDNHEIYHHMKNNLGRLAPKAIYWLPSFVTTPTGKIQRQASLEKYKDLINQ